MEKFVNVAQRTLAAISTWEERLEKRQEELSGKRANDCLDDSPADKWPRNLRQNRLVVAAMCLAEHECASCLNLLRKY